MNNMFNMLQGMMQNPLAVISQRFNIPQGMNNPQDIVNHLLKTNQISQQQLNNVMQMKNNPLFKGLFK